MGNLYFKIITLGIVNQFLGLKFHFLSNNNVICRILIFILNLSLILICKNVKKIYKKKYNTKIHKKCFFLWSKKNIQNQRNYWSEFDNFNIQGVLPLLFNYHRQRKMTIFQNVPLVPDALLLEIFGLVFFHKFFFAY